MATVCSHDLTQVRCLYPERVGEVCIYPKWVHNILQDLKIKVQETEDLDFV